MSLEPFLGDEPTRDLEAWADLWTRDLDFPSHGRPGLLGRAAAFLRRLCRPWLKLLLADHWERQRIFNLILLENVVNERHARRHTSARADDFQTAIEAHARLLEQLDRRSAEAMTDVMRHNDALFARVDQKLDRYRREARELWHRLGGLIAAGEAPAKALDSAARQAQEEQTYVELERRHRGSREEIAARVAGHLPRLRDVPGPILDLGCGRGEALDVFSSHGLEVRGVDGSREMVALCRERGLDAVAADLFDHLAGLEEGELGAVVSFHVIEHLPPASLERLVRLAWRALAPGGILILETPSPLSLVMSASHFWIDPTHRRPVHPASLEVIYRETGFEPVTRVDLHPFAAAERLPEIDLDDLPERERRLADQVNRLRDLLDDLLFGYRDFALVGHKPKSQRPETSDLKPAA